MRERTSLPIAADDSTLTPERLARLRRLHEAATPGPWFPEDASLPSSRAERYAIDAELIAETRNALPDLLGEVEFGRMMTESYLEASKRFDNLCMDLFRRIASGASLAEVVDLVGDYMDGCDAVDDESIAAFKAAKARAGVSDSENTQ